MADGDREIRAEGGTAPSLYACAALAGDFYISPGAHACFYSPRFFYVKKKKKLYNVFK